MPLDFLSMPRPAQRKETRDILSASNPDHTMRATLVKLDPAEDLAAVDLAQARIAEYMGDPEDNVSPTRSFPPIGGKVPALSRSLIFSVTRIEAMLKVEEGSEVYGFEQLVGMTITATGLWNALSGFATEMSKDPKP